MGKILKAKDVLRIKKQKKLQKNLLKILAELNKKVKKTKTLEKKVQETPKKTKKSTNIDYAKKQKEEYFQKLEYIQKQEYQKLFSYLTKSEYTEKVEFSETESTTDVLSSEKVDHIMKRKIMSEMLGGIRDIKNVQEEEDYKKWKMFNKQEWWWKIRFLNNSYGAREITGTEFYTV